MVQKKTYDSALFLRRAQYFRKGIWQCGQMVYGSWESIQMILNQGPISIFFCFCFNQLQISLEISVCYDPFFLYKVHATNFLHMWHDSYSLVTCAKHFRWKIVYETDPSSSSRATVHLQCFQYFGQNWHRSLGVEGAKCPKGPNSVVLCSMNLDEGLIKAKVLLPLFIPTK